MKVVLYDVTHTSHCGANSGIQRVVRRLARHWPSGDVVLQPVVYDGFWEAWRLPDAREKLLLDFGEQRKPGRKRGATWTLWQRLRGRWARWLGVKPDVFSGEVAAFICPEPFQGERRGENFGGVETQWGGKDTSAGAWKKIAVFCDMIAIDMPEKTPLSVVSRYRDYLERLREFDVVAAISEDSRGRLLRYWGKQGQVKMPEVVAIPLGVDSVAGVECVPAERGGAELPLVLSVGTLEGRKNHVALLEACEGLWEKGLRFRLRLIGMLNRETGAAAAGRVGALQAAGRSVEWWADAGDRALFASYRECDFTVYPSLYEGFGLPVLESLAHGRPCVCSGLSAMAEIVQGGGGCVAVGEPTAENIAGAMEVLLRDRAKIVALSREALARRIRSWDDYAGDVRALACG